MSLLYVLTQIRTQVQRVLTRKKQHAHQNSIVALKNAAQNERYLSGILLEMEIMKEKIYYA
jgi:hypothetical protein